MTKRLRHAPIGLVLTAFIGYALVYGAEVATWRNPGALAISALTERPNSMRAHQEAAAFFTTTGDLANAALLLNTIERRWPGQPGNYSQLVMLKCLDDALFP